MLAYQANRGMGIEEDDKEAQLARDTQNNAKNIRNAADVAVASGNPYAMAAGAGVKVADKVTKGKSSEALGKGMAKANQRSPFGRKMQDASNRMSESGVSDVAGKAAAIKSRAGSEKEAIAGKDKTDEELKEKLNDNKNKLENQVNTAANNAAQNVGNRQSAGGGQESSLPSSSERKTSETYEEEQEGSSKGLGRFLGRQAIAAVALTVLPFLFLVLILVVIIASVAGVFGSFTDAFGMSDILGEENGGVAFNADSKEQEDFLNRINDVKLSYQSQGKNLDAFKIVAIYNVLTANGVDISYEDVTTSVIENWANAMFDGSVYSEDTFKTNLINIIFPSYKPGESQAYYEDMADDVFSFIEQYYNLIGKEEDESTCFSGDSCTYDIKGYFIKSKGNVVENITVNNLYVRLMQCGTADGHNYGGTFGQPVDGEELVPFEKYILGVAYQEIGESAPEHAFKAQMVASRGYILARHADMGGWRTLKQEGDKWVLQAAACTQDQVYCDPDQGCSSEDGQWKMVFSGTTRTKKLRNPMPEDSQMRKWAAETAGEVLVNSQGYICYSGYRSSEHRAMKELAQQGLDYKQILLQIYNQGSRQLGATDIKKFSCSGEGGSGCVSSGEFSTWKQGDAKWGSIKMGNSGKTINQIGCLVTSVSMLIAKSGVPVNINPFNPGTFVEYMNQHNSFAKGGNFNWGSATQVAPTFKYQGKVSVAGMSKEAKLSKIKEIAGQNGVYAVAEVKGNTGQHWVAIDGVNGSTINMMDPASNSTDMWAQYNWANTSTIAYYKVG